MSRKRITRRRFIASSAATAAAISAPYVSTAYAAGKLSLGMWDHWVPGGNKVFDEEKKAVKELPGGTAPSIRPLLAAHLPPSRETAESAALRDSLA